MITSAYNKQNGILFTKYSGIINLKELLSDINNVGNDSSLPKYLKIITDARGAIYEFKPKDIHVAVAEIKKHINKFDFIKEALIQDDSYVTALSMLYELELNKIGHFNYKIFNTVEACYKWMNI